MKKNILFSIALIANFNLFSQSGQKWATGGNGLITGDFFGSTNNFPIIFKVNNIQRMSLSVAGVLQINGLSGSLNRLLQTDASGNIIPFTMGNANQYLAGNGVWVNFPAIPPSLWTQTGSGIFYNGNVGINNSHPQYALDITGDLNVTNNVYVGGGILISDKVHATSEVKSVAVRADSLFPQTIKLAANRDILGQANFASDIIAKSKFQVIGNSIFNGSVNVQGAFNANTIGANSISANNGTINNLSVGGTATFNQMNINQSISTPKVVSGHISAPDSNGVHIGDSSMVFLSFPIASPTYEVMRTNPLYRGIAIGTSAVAFGTTSNSLGVYAGAIAIGAKSQARAQSSFVFGYNVQTTPTANYAMALGAGLPGCCPMVNNSPYSLAVGFNSDIPTFFVSSSSGIGTVGKVGIGNTNPQHLLDVNGNVHINSQNGGAFISETSVGNLTMRHDGANGVIDVNVNGALLLNYYSGKNVDMCTGSGGLVNVGHNLQIGGHIGMTTGNQIYFKGFSDPAHGIGVFPGAVFNSYQSNPITIDGPIVYGWNGGALGSNRSGVIGGITRIALRWDDAGHVVIGGGIPGGNHVDAALAVYGKALFTSAYVNISTSVWSDYVFDSNYKLMPLSEVEKFYLQNKHLNGVPSAKEMEATGDNIVETDAMLLKKIEENTIYMVQLYKKLENQEKKLADQEELIKKLTEKIEKLSK
jgi:hypothetical protein